MGLTEKVAAQLRRERVFDVAVQIPDAAVVIQIIVVNMTTELTAEHRPLGFPAGRLCHAWLGLSCRQNDNCDSRPPSLDLENVDGCFLMLIDVCRNCF